MEKIDGGDQKVKCMYFCSSPTCPLNFTVIHQNGTIIFNSYIDPSPYLVLENLTRGYLTFKFSSETYISKTAVFFGIHTDKNETTSEIAPVLNQTKLLTCIASVTKLIQKYSGFVEKQRFYNNLIENINIRIEIT